jgi:hypothetical protein
MGIFATKNAENAEKKDFGGKWSLGWEDSVLLFALFAFFCG